MLMTILTYVGYGACFFVAFVLFVLFVAFSKAYAVKQVYGHWPHQSPEAMQTWRDLP